MLPAVIAPSRKGWASHVFSVQGTPLASRLAIDALAMALDLGSARGGTLAILIRPDGTLGAQTFTPGEPQGDWVCFQDGKLLNRHRLYYGQQKRLPSSGSLGAFIGH